VLGGEPAALPVRQLADVEAVLQDRADGVLGERVGAPVAAGAVARRRQRLRHLAVGLAGGGQLEHQAQAGRGNDASPSPIGVRTRREVEHGDAVGALDDAEGQEAVVQALGLALALALLGLLGQVVRVELGEAAHRRHLQPPHRGGVVHLLAHGDEADARPLQAPERLELDAEVAGEAVQLVDDEDVEPAVLGVGEHLLERGAFVDRVGPG
jgi:hypothetical protein